MPPKTKCMAKLVQSRGLKRLRTQFRRHQNGDPWFQSPHILATHLQDLKQGTTIAGSPLASDVTQRWSPALHAHLRLERILHPRDRQQHGPCAQRLIDTVDPALLPAIGFRATGRFDPDAPTGQGRNAEA